MSCVILRDKVFRGRATGHGLCDPQRLCSLARVLSCRRDAQVRISFARLDHLRDCGHVHPCCRSRFRKRTTNPLPIQKCVLENKAGNKTPHPCCRRGQTLHVHPCFRTRAFAPQKNKIRSLASVTVSSIVEVTVEKRPPNRTRPLCTARPSSASRRASSSRQVATAPSRAWSLHCASREQGSLPRHAALAKLSPADPHDE